MQNKVYISAPIAMEWSTVLSYKSKLDALGFDVKLWDRNFRNYRKEDFDSADTVVILLPNNKFNGSQRDLPIGVCKEISDAYAQSKSIFIGYTPNSGVPEFYRAGVELGTRGYFTIRGEGGSTNAIRILAANVDKQKSAKKIATNSVYGLTDYMSGSWGDDSGEKYSSNPCAEIALPTAKKIHGITVSTAKKVNPDLIEERLLLMM
jgi:hypothetical protein